MLPELKKKEILMSIVSWRSTDEIKKLADIIKFETPKINEGFIELLQIPNIDQNLVSKYIKNMEVSNGTVDNPVIIKNEEENMRNSLMIQQTMINNNNMNMVEQPQPIHQQQPQTIQPQPTHQQPQPLQQPQYTQQRTSGMGGQRIKPTVLWAGSFQFKNITLNTKIQVTRISISNRNIYQTILNSFQQIVPPLKFEQQIEIVKIQLQEFINNSTKPSQEMNTKPFVMVEFSIDQSNQSDLKSIINSMNESFSTGQNSSTGCLYIAVISPQFITALIPLKNHEKLIGIITLYKTLLALGNNNMQMTGTNQNTIGIVPNMNNFRVSGNTKKTFKTQNLLSVNPNNNNN